MSETGLLPTDRSPRLGMNAIGYLMGIVLFLLLIPVLPLIAVLVLVYRYTGVGDGDGKDRRPSATIE